MAEDTVKSPRVRKLSWADMVDEEEELMLAKETFQKAMKEREQQKTSSQREKVNTKRRTEQTEKTHFRRSPEQRDTTELRGSPEQKERGHQRRSPEQRESIQQRKSPEQRRRAQQKSPLSGERTQQRKSPVQRVRPEYRRSPDRRERTQQWRSPENRNRIQQRRRPESRDRIQQRRRPESRDRIRKKRSPEYRERALLRRSPEHWERTYHRRSSEQWDRTQQRRSPEYRERVHQRISPELWDRTQQMKSPVHWERMHHTISPELWDRTQHMKSPVHWERMPHRRSPDQWDRTQQRRSPERRASTQSRRSPLRWESTQQRISLERRASYEQRSLEQRDRTEQKTINDPLREFTPKDRSSESYRSCPERSLNPKEAYEQPVKDREQLEASKVPEKDNSTISPELTEKPVHPSPKSHSHGTQTNIDSQGQSSPETHSNIDIMPFKSFKTEKPKDIRAPFKQDERISCSPSKQEKRSSSSPLEQEECLTKSVCDLKENKSSDAISKINIIPFKGFITEKPIVAPPPFKQEVQTSKSSGEPKEQVITETGSSSSTSPEKASKDAKRKPISKHDGPSRSVPYIPLNSQNTATKSPPAAIKKDKLEALVDPPQERKKPEEELHIKATHASLEKEIVPKYYHRGDGDSAQIMKCEKHPLEPVPQIHPTHQVVNLGKANYQSAVRATSTVESSMNTSDNQSIQSSSSRADSSTKTAGGPIQILKRVPVQNMEEHSTVQRSPKQELSVKATSCQTLPDKSVEKVTSSSNHSPKDEESGKVPSGGIRILKRSPPTKLDTPAAQSLQVGSTDDNVEQPSVLDTQKPDTTASPQTDEDHMRRPPLLPTPPDSERLMNPDDTDQSEENRLTWGDVVNETSSMDILKEELKRFKGLSNDLKTIVEDQQSYRAQLDEMLKDSLVIFDTHKESAIREDKIGYWITRGLIFMESPKFGHHAIDAFTKAVKLEPSSIDSWNNLGDCYCSLGDFEMSKKCFLSALAQEKNVVSYQNLSMLCRLKRPREKEDNQDGINYAKEALACDFSCTKSWAILGNAYMAAFFASGQNEQFVNKALHAYRKADNGEVLDYEVCYNKFIALKFLEDYDEALKTLSPSLSRLEVEWKEAKTDYMSLVNYLKQVQELIDKKGKIRPKRRQEYIKQLRSRKPSEDERAAEREGSLRISGTVIWILSPDGSYPYTVGLLTASEEIFAVSVFNLVTSKGFTIGDTMNIPVASKTSVHIHVCEQEFKFSKIRIFVPTDIILNGKRLSMKVLQPYEFHSN
ncbi:hypothetical protein GE061_000450 [Apolygus lucorum]|uniref:Tetratricopeptide repeat protein 5 OB fold domain-containing protein n=1 Tax=Apolygus lucorum TaxID=248454 RepID=A0A6A4KKP6_APOLU|nr:hypothetical protein GE061_000450 [Apolygus lucorum]